jgi:glycosyltransferase involved in cell wall biosynthesis
MSRLLFVVHRYGFPGGSEYNVQRLAEQAVKEGHDVTVLAAQNTGDLNGVKVTNIHPRVFEQWDLIIVHGSCPSQDFVHTNSEAIESPIYYMLIQPSDSDIVQLGMKHARWIGCGTTFDEIHAIKYGHRDKMRWFQYGINTDINGDEGQFKQRYGIDTSRMYLSVGGFWPHKRHAHLAEVFRRVRPEDTTLVLMGYDTRFGPAPTQGEGVVVIYGAEQQEIFNAMWDGDLLIQNSESEGYGLTLLEAMHNYCPWISTDVAAAHDLHRSYGYGGVYHTENELEVFLEHGSRRTTKLFDEEKHYVEANHNMHIALKSILKVLDE